MTEFEKIYKRLDLFPEYLQCLLLRKWPVCIELDFGLLDISPKRMFELYLETGNVYYTSYEYDKFINFDEWLTNKGYDL